MGEFDFGVQNETGQRRIEFCQENSLVITKTFFQQCKRWLYIWTSPAGKYQNYIYYIFCNWRWKCSTQFRSSVRLKSSAPSCKLKLKKVGKTTRPFRYDLNQIPYAYTVEVTNRFKGLDLIDRMPENLCMGVCNVVKEVVYQNHSPKKEMQEGKMNCLSRPYK